jgi:hypothetical protein
VSSFNGARAIPAAPKVIGSHLLPQGDSPP